MAGKVQADESAVITSKINARPSEISVDVGSTVNKGDNVIIEQDSIICIESLVRKRYIKTDTQSYISLKSLSYWQSVLDEDKFFLVNKSFIVNIDRVERFTDKYIELKGIEEPIDLSREKRTAFKQKMLLYLAGQE